MDRTRGLRIDFAARSDRRFDPERRADSALWIAPLSLYLLSFILCFENDRIYNRIVFLPLLAGSLALFAWGDYIYENNGDVTKRLIPALCAALFVCCMVCHGELARRKPHPRYLTRFYLMVAGPGGAPEDCSSRWRLHACSIRSVELPIAMIACAALTVCAVWVAWPAWARAAAALATIGFAIYLGRAEVKKNRDYVLSARNFYGVLHVRDDPDAPGETGKRVLIHGTINHGTQLLGPGTDRIPTSYFGSGSGISRAIHALGDAGPIRIGILGLGAGVTAALAPHRAIRCIITRSIRSWWRSPMGIWIFSRVPGRQAAFHGGGAH